MDQGKIVERKSKIRSSDRSLTVIEIASVFDMARAGELLGWERSHIYGTPRFFVSAESKELLRKNKIKFFISKRSPLSPQELNL